MTQANHLFTDPYQLPQYPMGQTTKKPKGVWEPRELDFDQPEQPAGKKDKNSKAPKTKEGGKTPITKVRASNAISDSTSKVKRPAKARSSALNDERAGQSGPKDTLPGEHVELADRGVPDSWHPPMQRISGNESVETEAQTQAEVTKLPPGTEATLTTEPTREAELHMAKMDVNPDPSEQESHEPRAFRFTNGQDARTQLTPQTIKAMEVYAKSRYIYPRVFVLIVQIAYLVELQNRRLVIGTVPKNDSGQTGEDGQITHVATERLLGRAMHNTVDVRRALYRNLNAAQELLLLDRKEVKTHGKPVTYWALTNDGRHFLMMGIRTRNALRKVACYSDEEICCQVSADELEEWKLDAEERAQVLVDHFGASGKRAPSLCSDVSRTALVQAIKQQALMKIHTSGVSRLWCGLVR